MNEMKCEETSYWAARSAQNIQNSIHRRQEKKKSIDNLKLISISLSNREVSKQVKIFFFRSIQSVKAVQIARKLKEFIL